MITYIRRNKRQALELAQFGSNRCNRINSGLIRLKNLFTVRININKQRNTCEVYETKNLFKAQVIGRCSIKK